MKIAILSDIHANYAALEAVIQKLAWLEDETGETFTTRFLGDLIGYGPTIDTLACIRWLRECPNSNWVPGNHDEWIISPNGGVREEAKLTLLSQKIFLSKEENAEDWNWFNRKVSDVVEGKTAAIHTDETEDFFISYSHASIGKDDQRSTYLYPWQLPLIGMKLQGYFTQALPTAPTNLVCVGHTHFPMLIQQDDTKVLLRSIKYGQPIDISSGKYMINPGSIGQGRDGDPRASFAIVDTEARTLVFHKVEYNRNLTIRKLNAESTLITRKQASNPSLLGLTKQDVDPLYELLGYNLGIESSEKIKKAYDRLVNHIATGDGGQLTQDFKRMYSIPEFDLTAFDHSFHNLVETNME